MAKVLGQSFIQLFARDFQIAWGDDKRYWKWINFPNEASVAELIEVCFFDARTKFDTSILHPGTKYEVSFLIVVKENAEGWQHPVKLGFVIPNVIEEEREEDFSKLGPKNQKIEIPVGKFIAPCQAGQMEIYMSGTESLIWKKGIVFMGAMIRSTN
ncbi:Phloem protein 2-like protein [Melia azedarach]|uniref:Phloem protein 2-like protein n=1 Tax=Melia azedarach TaxID=155640 RepID=A0ACC1WTS1_MELAZ|nr:Phloem protein 2-like protein [Melia azedarach]